MAQTRPKPAPTPPRITSLINGKPSRQHTDRVERSTNPANLADVVAEVALVRPEGVLAACRAAKAVQASGRQPHPHAAPESSSRPGAWSRPTRNPWRAC